MGLFGRHKKRWSSVFGSSSSGSAPAASASAPAVVIQDFPGTIGFRVQEVLVTEGDVAHLQIERFGGANTAATVYYSTVSFATGPPPYADNIAVPGVSYTHVNGNVSWVAGDAAPKYIDIPTTRLTGYTGTKRFSVYLTVFQGAGPGYFRTQVISILDLDASNQGPTYFRPVSVSYSVAENGTSVAVQVMRLGSLVGAVSIAADAVNGTALSGTHYTDTPATLSWADGEGGAKTFTVNIINVGGAGGNKVFYVNLTNPVGGIIDDVYDQVAVTIIDDESFPVSPGQIDIQAECSISEGATGGTNIAVTRTAGTTGSVYVQYAITDGTALSGIDFVAGNGQLFWADGDYSVKSILFTPVNNAAVRGDRTCSIVLSNITGGATLGNATCAIQIQEDDRYSDVVAYSGFSMWEGATITSDADLLFTHVSVLARQFGLLTGAGTIAPSAPQDSNGQSPDLITPGGAAALGAQTPTGGNMLQLV